MTGKCSESDSYRIGNKNKSPKRYCQVYFAFSYLDLFPNKDIPSSILFNEVKNRTFRNYHRFVKQIPAPTELYSNSPLSKANCIPNSKPFRTSL